MSLATTEERAGAISLWTVSGVGVASGLKMGVASGRVWSLND